MQVIILTVGQSESDGMLISASQWRLPVTVLIHPLSLPIHRYIHHRSPRCPHIIVRELISLAFVGNIYYGPRNSSDFQLGIYGERTKRIWFHILNRIGPKATTGAWKNDWVKKRTSYGRSISCVRKPYSIRVMRTCAEERQQTRDFSWSNLGECEYKI